MAQGIPWNKENIYEALAQYLELGYSIHKSCEMAGIAYTTVMTWVENDESLRIKMEALRNSVSVQATKNLKEKINEGDEESSKWWLERKEKKDFSTRTETDVTSDGKRIEAGIFVTDFKSTDS